MGSSDPIKQSWVKSKCWGLMLKIISQFWQWCLWAVLAHPGNETVEPIQQDGSLNSQAECVPKLGCRWTSAFKEHLFRTEQLPVCLFYAVASDCGEIILVPYVLIALHWNSTSSKEQLTSAFFLFQLICLVLNVVRNIIWVTWAAGSPSSPTSVLHVSLIVSLKGGGSTFEN